MLAEPVAAILDSATQLTVAIGTKRGPHVTPELFVVHDGRIWCLAAATTLKVGVLSRHPRAGLLARSGRGREAVVMAADAVVIDPARPIDALGHGLAAVKAPVVVAEFMARNHLEMAGAALDAASLQLGTPPPRRVLLGFEPVATAVIADAGDVSVEGTWAGSASEVDAQDDAGPGGLAEVPLDQLTGDLAALLDRPDAVLGWATPAGPLALPVGWARATSEATVSPALFEAVGAPAAGPCSLMVDDWTALGPTGKRGVMLRGAGEVSGGPATVRITADRAVWWEGVDTGTAAA